HPIQGGDSGGPVVNAHGEIIGTISRGVRIRKPGLFVEGTEALFDPQGVPWAKRRLSEWGYTPATASSTRVARPAARWPSAPTHARDAASTRDTSAAAAGSAAG